MDFSFLESDAVRVGRTGALPTVQRQEYRLPRGGLISALRFGDVEPRFVFLHGAGLNAHTFDPVVLALDAPAMSFDLAGHGRSDWRDDATYTPETLAPDIAWILSQEDFGPVNVVGQSLGALTAANIVSLVPEIVRSLTVIDVTPGVSPVQDATSIREFIQGQRTFTTIDEIVDRAIAFNIGTDREALSRGVTLNTRVRPDGLLEWTHHLAHLDGLTGDTHGSERPFAALWAPLEDLGERVTLVRGSHGMVTRQMQEEWSSRLPLAGLVTLDGGHNLQEHAPVELAETLHHIATTSP